jgi:tetratricopeptide (TPR) repeat protein
MNRLWMLLLLTITLLPALPAQDADKPAEEEPKAEKELSTDIPADFVAYVRTIIPNADPVGEHSLAELKNYTEKDKRHRYTATMAQLVLMYLKDLDLGSAISNLFDQYSRSKFGEYATFKVLHAVLLTYYPATGQNTDRAAEILLQLTKTHKDYAHPWYYLANVESLRQDRSGTPNFAEAKRLLQQAIDIQPDYIEAKLFKVELMIRTPATTRADLIEVLKPMIEAKAPDDLDEYSRLLTFYASALAGPDEFAKVITAHLARPELTEKQRIRAMMIHANRYLAPPVRPDDALQAFEGIEKIVDPAKDPIVALRMHQLGASCCFQKLVELSQKLPDSRADYDGFFAELLRHHRRAVEIEQVHLPIALRGDEAERFVMVQMKLADGEPGAGLRQQKREKALLWLGTYLKETDLTASHRRRLEDLQANIHLMLNPTEEGYIRKLENYEAAKDIPKMHGELATKRERVRLQLEEFTLQVSLDFFLRQINSSDDNVARHAAYLAVHTAKNRGGEAIPLVGKAIADRFEKAGELKTELQGRFLDDLCDSIRTLGDKTGLERVVRQLVVIAENEPEKYQLSQLMAGWTADAFLKTIAGAPKAMGAQDRRSPTTSAAWLKELADAIKKAREAEEKG